jgi:hypothetical protein
MAERTAWQWRKLKYLSNRARTKDQMKFVFPGRGIEVDPVPDRTGADARETRKNDCLRDEKRASVIN